MELDPIATAAVRGLSVDVGNLTARLAVISAVIEDLVKRMNSLDPSTWKMEPDGERDYNATLPGAEMNKLQGILQVLRSLE
jgi:hypothetical protein